MSIDDIDEYTEVAEAYRDSLSKLHIAMASCNVQGINSLLDSMDALESAVMLMIEDFSRAGAYDADTQRLSPVRLEAAYPHAATKVRKLISIMHEAREISWQLADFQSEIKGFFQEDILANTYDVKRKG